MRQSIQQLEFQIGQLSKDRIAEVARELRDGQVRLRDIGPQLHLARETLECTARRSPATGIVARLTALTEGVVNVAGPRVMDIVPDHGEGNIEATIGVGDQKDVYPRVAAEVHLIAYKQRSAPVAKGVVTQFSPDHFTAGVLRWL